MVTVLKSMNTEMTRTASQDSFTNKVLRSNLNRVSIVTENPKTMKIHVLQKLYIDEEFGSSM